MPFSATWLPAFSQNSRHKLVTPALENKDKNGSYGWAGQREVGESALSAWGLLQSVSHCIQQLLGPNALAHSGDFNLYLSQCCSQAWVTCDTSMLVSHTRQPCLPVLPPAGGSLGSKICCPAWALV